MKVAFHFNAMHPSIAKKGYGYECEKKIFHVLLKHRNLSVSSKIFVGDLLLNWLANDRTRKGNQTEYRSNRSKFERIVQGWLSPENSIWIKLLPEKVMDALQQEIFAICFETLTAEMALYIHNELKEFPAYIGALEVDDASIIHWELYSNSLLSTYRLVDKEIRIFWNGMPDGSKDKGLLETMESFGFKRVEFESLNGKYTIFDEYHDFDHARRVAEWKRRSGDLLAFIAEDVVHRLGDAAPDLGDRLWAILQTFETAETNEQLSQVATSCRRIIEYVSDQLFPPSDGTFEGRKIGTSQYRNRLLAFADSQRRSDTDIDVICVNTTTLSEQMEKLANLANKGTHAEVYKTETRRCLLRTILLLDDIMSLRRKPFEIKAILNYDDFIQNYDNFIQDDEG